MGHQEIIRKFVQQAYMILLGVMCYELLGYVLLAPTHRSMLITYISVYSR